MKLDRAMWFLCAGVVLTIAGLGIALLSAVILAGGYYVRQWPTTHGVVVRSEIEVSKQAGGFRRSGVTVYRDYYVGHVEYKYNVDGRAHTADVIGGSGGAGSFYPRVAQAVIEKYPVGQAVTVAFDPRRPESAVIDRSFNFALWWTACGFAFVVGCSGIYCWLKAIRIDDARRAAEQPAAAQHARQRVVSQLVAPPPVANSLPVRGIHWALRIVAVLVGLLSFFLGSLVMVQIAGRVPRPEISRAVWITAILIPAVFTLFGAFLIRRGMAVRRSFSLSTRQPTA